MILHNNLCLTLSGVSSLRAEEEELFIKGQRNSLKAGKDFYLFRAMEKKFLVH